MTPLYRVASSFPNIYNLAVKASAPSPLFEEAPYSLMAAPLMFVEDTRILHIVGWIGKQYVFVSPCRSSIRACVFVPGLSGI